MKDRIKAVRKAAGLNQTEFGKRVGVSLSAVQKWESGENVLSDAVVLLVCREYGVSETWLRTGAGEMRGARTREEELTELVAGLMADRPESFRSALLTVLLRIRPDGPEWAALVAVYNSVRAETEKSPGE